MNPRNALKLRATLLAGLTLILLPAAAAAQEADMPALRSRIEYDTTTEVMPESDVALDVSLRDAVTQCLLNHPELRAAWHAGQIEAADIEGAGERFDVMLNGEINVPVATESMVFSRELANVSLGRSYTTGTRLSAEYHLERDPDGLFISSDGSTELYRHRAGLRVEQAMARGGSRDGNRALVRAEEADFAAAADNYRRQAQETVFTAEKAYWNLFASQRIEIVYQEALRGAERLFELSRTQYDAGNLSRLDMTIAEAGVASRREDVILARIDAAKARDQLMALMLGTTAPSWMSSHVSLLTPPDTTMNAEASIPQLADVLAARDDYRAADHALDAAEQRILASRNDSRNRFDLVLETGYAAMGSSPGNEYLDPVSGQAVSGPYVFVGCELEMALPGSGSNAASRRAAEAREAAHWRRESVQRSVVLQIRQARMDLDSSLERVRVTRTARTAVEQQVRGEREKFAMGQASSHSALLSENDLRAARIREIRALADLQIARARLRLAVGGTLDEYGLKLD
jgi:outer membrane protein TolC